MKTKSNVYLAQVNNRFGNNVFLPYSAGILQAYCQAKPELRQAYDFKPIVFERENPNVVASRMDSPAVLGLSCYIWNWEWSNALVKAVRSVWPECLIVMGGPQVPDDSFGFFEEHPCVDFLVHGEGEETFAEILSSFSLDATWSSPGGVWSTNNGPTRLAQTAGLSMRVRYNQTLKTVPRKRREDLSELPSPYLTGVFDELLAANPDLDFQASQETHRGCPYSCTFCDWGSAVFTKVRPFPTDRIIQEYEWFGRNRIDLLYNTDANYGILPRDLELTDDLVASAGVHGYPKQIRVAWAKNTNDRVFEMARSLHEAGMDKGVTLSLQSLDPHTLETVKRKNIKMDNFAELAGRYRDAGIPTYTELILGLPGETYGSFALGLDKLLRAGGHDGINIYLCALLPNSEMSQPAYLRRHGIRSVRSPILQQHSTAAEDDIAEFNDIVVGTDRMPIEDWTRCYMLAWAVQTFHTMGLLQDLAILSHNNGVMYRSFYEDLLSFGRSRPLTVVGTEMAYVLGRVEEALKGGGWGASDSSYGDVVWPLEEFSFLNIVTGNLDRFYGEALYFLVDLLPGAERTLGLAVQRQQEAMRAPAEFDGDVEEFAKRVVWYGRKGGTFRKEPLWSSLSAP